MKRWLPWLAVMIGCTPSDPELREITLDFGGRLVETGTNTGVSGIQISIVQLDSLIGAGLQPTVTTDTSLTTGEFAARVRLDRPGSSCDNRNRPLTVTLRFRDPLNRYQTADSPQALCRYTLAELLSATTLMIELVPN